MNWTTKRLPHRLSDDEDDGPQKIISIEKSSTDNSVAGNKIYFYQDVSRDTILTLNRQIDDVSRQIKNIQFIYNLPEPPPIEIHFCSDGGDVFAAMSIVDKLANSLVPIHTYCEGVVASATTLLSVVGKKRFITPRSCMLIHQVSSGLWGNYMEFKDEIKNLELVMSLIRGVYLKHTKYTSDELDKILSHDLYLSSEECLKMGLVDEIQ
jgi:ATP-dependent Clp endopeptidase proteolytic subunit ClpP